MEPHTIGIDLGKTVFHLVGLNLRVEEQFNGFASSQLDILRHPLGFSILRSRFSQAIRHLPQILQHEARFSNQFSNVSLGVRSASYPKPIRPDL
jgi:hypothetical protein